MVDRYQICQDPRHRYTELLLASIPDPDPLVQPQNSERRRYIFPALTWDLLWSLLVVLNGAVLVVLFALALFFSAAHKFRVHRDETL